VRVDETRNLVIIAGSQRELRHLLDTIELFDVDWLSGYSVGLFPIKSADVKTLWRTSTASSARARRARSPASCA
jgi:general secretion pathway protein D